MQTIGHGETQVAALMSDPIAILEDPQVRTYLTGIFGSNELRPETKYQRLLELFLRERQIREQVNAKLRESAGTEEHNDADTVKRAIAAVARERGVWNPVEVRAEIGQSIRRSLTWIRQNQREDGGWAKTGEDQSQFWESAWSALCLSAARKLVDPGSEFIQAVVPSETLRKALGWISAHVAKRGEWFDQTDFRVYEIALAIICFCEIGEGFESSYGGQVTTALKWLANAAHSDGGWRAQFNKDSEAGATSMALRALCSSGKREYLRLIEHAAECLMSMQNPDDGSWGETQIERVNKTCDGVLGLLAARRVGVVVTGAEEAIDRGVKFLETQEKPVVERGVIKGWAWGLDFLPKDIPAEAFEHYTAESSPDDEESLRGAYSQSQDGIYRLREDLSEEHKSRLPHLLWRSGYAHRFDSTCLTLEVLVRLERPPLPMLASSTRWLLDNQSVSADPHEGGGWVVNTGRITRSLIECYRQLSAQGDELPL